MGFTSDGLESARARRVDVAGAGVGERLLKPALWSSRHPKSVTRPTAGKAVTLSRLANEGAAQEMRQSRKCLLLFARAGRCWRRLTGWRGL